MSRAIERRSPDGSLVRDVNEYVESWERPLEGILGWKLRAMNPEYVFEDEQGERVTLTVGQANKLVEKLTAQKHLRPVHKECRDHGCYMFPPSPEREECENDCRLLRKG